MPEIFRYLYIVSLVLPLKKYCKRHKDKFKHTLFANSRTENSPVNDASLNKADIFYGWFDIFGIPNKFWKGIGSV